MTTFTPTEYAEIKKLSDKLASLEMAYKAYTFNTATTVHLIKDNNERALAESVVNKERQALSEKINKAERDVGMFVHCLMVSKK